MLGDLKEGCQRFETGHTGPNLDNTKEEEGKKEGFHSLSLSMC
jgi:hypothetical protein